jgi:rhodanese-related sulfurtransferase
MGSVKMIVAELKNVLRQSFIILAFTVIVALIINVLRPAGISLFGFSSSELIKKRQAQIPEISLTDAHNLFMQKKVIFIDARDPISFANGHIAGALNIYPDEAELYAAKLKVDNSRDLLIVTYCDGPYCPLSKETAYALVQQGVPQAKVLVNGWSLWLKAGYPVKKGKE